MTASPEEALLDPEERKVLDLVADHQLVVRFANPTPLSEVILAYPCENAQRAQEMVERLIAKGYLARGRRPKNVLYLTPTGLLACTRGGEAAGIAERMLGYLKRRAETERSAFTQTTWDELKTAGVVTTDAHLPMAAKVFEILRLHGNNSGWVESPPSGSWGVPIDMVDLRRISDVRGLRERAERFDAQEAWWLDSVNSSTKSEIMYMSTNQPDPKKVFIIHGRNLAARTAVEHFLKALGLQPVDFDVLAADQGGAAFVGDIVRAGLEQAQGIVALFTPEEYAALRPDHRGADRPEEIQRWQARPNVIFEAGMAYGMDRERTILVTMGTDVSLFSDVAGVHVVRLSNNIESRKRLRQKLIGVKCSVDLRDDSWTDPTRSGDFDACIKQLQGVSPRDPFCP